jgi:hypothetical protein
VTPTAKREATRILVQEHHLSRVWACRAVGLARSALYKPTWTPQRAVFDLATPLSDSDELCLVHALSGG